MLHEFVTLGCCTFATAPLSRYGPSCVDVPSGGKVEDSLLAKAMRVEAAWSRRADSMAVRTAWFSMPIKSGADEGTWSGVPRARGWGKAGAWRGCTLLNGREQTAIAANLARDQFCKSGARDDRAT